MSDLTYCTILIIAAVTGAEMRVQYARKSKEKAFSSDDYLLTVFATIFFVHAVLSAII